MFGVMCTSASCLCQLNSLSASQQHVCDDVVHYDVSACQLSTDCLWLLRQLCQRTAMVCCSSL